MMHVDTLSDTAGGTRKFKHYQEMKSFRNSYHNEQGGAAEACWAHNPKVGGSKPLPANKIF